MRPKVSFVLLKGDRRNIPHDEPLGQSETKTITLRIHSIQVIPSGLLMSYRISLSEGVASVVSSRQRSECRVLVIWTPVPTGQMLHIALRCLEGSTMSNLVHRRRRCARIGPIWYCCLEGSTPEDGEVSLLRRGRWRDSFPSLVTTLHTPGGRTLPYDALSGS